MSYRDRARDLRVADDVVADNDLMCAAHGCPNRWSVQRGGERGLCSAHAWADPKMWPIVTQEQQDAAVQAQQRAPASVPRRDPERLRAALEPLREQSDPRAWIARLQARANGGERLTQTQREMLESAVRQAGMRSERMTRDDELIEADRQRWESA